jgi:Zn-dependent peptidase ImmA (M78 family)/DNA-binding transcriptional regulator YiaG
MPADNYGHLSSTELSMANEALITGELVRWARERSGLSYADIAKSLHVDIRDVKAWEEEEYHPPFGKAQDLARLLRVPFGYLFLSKPPADDVPIPDFRTVTDRAPRTPSPEFMDVLNQALLKQEWYREYAEQSGMRPLPFIGRYSVNGIHDIARDIRDSVGINADLRQNARDWSAYLRRVSQNAEGVGVLVMRSGTVGSDNTRPLDVQEFRGFAVTDKYAPVVFVNSKDAVAAQTFTLVHELAHIWIGQSGISNPDPSEIGGPALEQFCNRVAAEVLVPTDEFLDTWDLTRRSITQFTDLARSFWVSGLVVLRKAFEQQKIGRDEFFRLVKQEKSADRPKRKGGKGGDPYARIVARNSRKLTLAVQGAVRENRLLYQDAAHLLEVSSVTLTKLMKKRLG